MALDTVSERVVVMDGQLVYETPRTYELWQESPSLMFLARFLKAHIDALIVRGGDKSKMIVYIDGQPIAEYKEQP